MHQAFELRGQDHIHEDDREQERPEKLAKRRIQLAPPSRDPRCVSRRKIQVLRFSPQRLQSISQRITRRDGCAHTHLPLPVQAIDARCGIRRHECDKIVQSNQPPIRPGHEKARDFSGSIPLPFLQPQLHFIRVVHSRIVKAGHTLVPAHHDAQGCRNVFGIHAQRSRPVPVYHHAKLRLV